MWKEHDVVMLPTKEKATNEDISYKGELYLWKNKLYYKTDSEYPLLQSKSYHLYILSDEEIKEGDWFIQNNKELLQYKRKSNTIGCFFDNNNELQTFHSNKRLKIIASTDKSLNLPELSDTFTKEYIKEYNKGNKIEEVLVEYDSELITKNEEDADYFNYDDGTKLNKNFNKIKVSKDNTIIIKPIKNNYTKEEVKELCKSAWAAGYDNGYSSHILTSEKLIPFKTWKKENL